ncbi:hypothetical protein D3C81_1742640 [compost metagenome]
MSIPKISYGKLISCVINPKSLCIFIYNLIVDVYDEHPCDTKEPQIVIFFVFPLIGIEKRKNSGI